MPQTFEFTAIRVILLDIEGTTTPIDFVFKTLFPFAAEHVEEFLREHSSDPESKTLIAELRSTWSGAASSGAPVWIESTPEEKIASAAAYVRWLIARDSKITPLKTLQGKIWDQGFRSGALKGEVYPDVAPAFARWHEQRKRIAIFSSGSVLAQKLLFANSSAEETGLKPGATREDLTPYIEAYFDTTTGPKREAGSYRKIVGALGVPTPEVLFVSDVEAELDAAKEAGMKTVQSLRPGITPASNAAQATIRSFDEL